MVRVLTNQLSSWLFDMFRRACRMIDEKGFVIRNVTRWIVMLASASILYAVRHVPQGMSNDR
jgi:hypothetical protein